VWGAQSYYLVAADRDSPTRYAYQYPLYTRGYTNNRIVGEFVHDVRSRPPRIIVENGDWCTLPLDSTARIGWHLEGSCIIPAPLRSLAHDITSHYRVERIDGCVGTFQCSVYVRSASRHLAGQSRQSVHAVSAMNRVPLTD
jgi:hypothetical protein